VADPHFFSRGDIGRHTLAQDKTDRLSVLRKKAEAFLDGQKKHKKSNSQASSNLIEELHVHQIELEMQNEELQKTQQQLEDSRDRYSDLYDFAPIGYLTCDVDGRIISANLTCAKMLGVERSSLKGAMLYRSVPRESQDALFLHRQGIINTGKRQACELKLVRKDRTSFDALLESVPIQDTSDKTLGFRTIISDITEKKKTEDGIKRGLARFPDESPYPIVRIGSDGSVIYANRPAKSFLSGLDSAEGKQAPARWKGWIAKARADKSVYTADAEYSGRIYTFDIMHIEEAGYTDFYIHDVTERRKAEEALKENEERFRLLSDLSFEGLAIHEEGMILTINQTFAKMFGYGHAELIGKSVLNLAAPESVDLIKKKSVSTEDETYEAVGLRKDGTKFIGQLSVRPLDYKGCKCRFISIRDITEKKKAEEALRASEEKLSTVLKKSPIPTAVGGFDGSIISFNEALEELIGYKQSEIKDTRDWSEKLYPDKKYREFVDKNIKQALDGKEQDCVQFAVTCKDGSEKIVEFHTSFFGEGLVIQMVDLTEKKNAEEKLKESDRKYKCLFETSRDAIMTLEPPSWLFTSGNPSTVKMFRCEDEKGFISYAPFELSPEHQPCGKDSKTKALEMINKAMEEGSNFFEWMHRRADGQEFPATVLLTRVEIESGKPFLQATVRDKTVQKFLADEKERLHMQAQERLSVIEKQNQKLIQLQNQLKAYSKVLENRVKKFEEKNVALTDKEKLCLYGLVAYPDLNDRELSQKLNLNRSTITSIRNRLKSEKWYAELNIPNLHALGCQALTFVYGRFNNHKNAAAYRSKFAPRCMIHAIGAVDNFVTVFAPTDIIMLQKEIDSLLLLATKQKVMTKLPAIVHFPFELSRVHALFDHANLLHSAFKLDIAKEVRQEIFCPPGMKLNKNMKDVLYALVKYPGATTAEIARKLRLARPTVANIQKNLWRGGLYRRAVIPNIKKLGFEFINMWHAKFKMERVGEVKTELDNIVADRLPASILITQNKEAIALQVFRNYQEQTALWGDRLQKYTNRKLLSDDSVTMILETDKIKNIIIDFVPITRQLLGVNDDI